MSVTRVVIFVIGIILISIVWAILGAFWVTGVTNEVAVNQVNGGDQAWVELQAERSLSYHLTLLFGLALALWTLVCFSKPIVKLVKYLNSTRRKGTEG